MDLLNLARTVLVESGIGNNLCMANEFKTTDVSTRQRRSRQADSEAPPPARPAPGQRRRRDRAPPTPASAPSRSSRPQSQLAPPLSPRAWRRPPLLSGGGAAALQARPGPCRFAEGLPAALRSSPPPWPLREASRTGIPAETARSRPGTTPRSSLARHVCLRLCTARLQPLAART
jgi:hypothetical protein